MNNKKDVNGKDKSNYICNYFLTMKLHCYILLLNWV